jgi:hypothetical protein
MIEICIDLWKTYRKFVSPFISLPLNEEEALYNIGKDLACILMGLFHNDVHIRRHFQSE